MYSAISIWTLWVLVVILLVSCANPTSTPGTMPKQPSPSVSTTSSSLPAYLTQFMEQDSGRTVTYTVTSRFGITLNSQKYPEKNVQVSCTPPRTIESVSNLPSVPPPLYAVRYEGVQPGLCTIKNGTFLLTVRIIPLDQ
jgi:hypothetical protein